MNNNNKHADVKPHITNGTTNGPSADHAVPQKPPQTNSGVFSWDYDEDSECGPHNWPLANGHRIGISQLQSQSPVDLHLQCKQAVPLNDIQHDPLHFVHYERPIVGEMVNTGHSVQFIPESRIDPPEIYGGKLDQHYRFIQYHYHWAQNDNEGSEHTLSGHSFPAELHLVHQGVDDPSKLAVLGVFLQLASNETDATAALQAEAQVLPKVKCFGQKVAVPAQALNQKLPKKQQSFVRYQGSLTTPPCSENVTWTVFTEPVSVTREQLNLLRAVEDCRGKVIHKNYRPLQPLNARTLHYC